MSAHRRNPVEDVHFTYDSDANISSGVMKPGRLYAVAVDMGNAKGRNYDRGYQWINTIPQLKKSFQTRRSK